MSSSSALSWSNQAEQSADDRLEREALKRARLERLGRTWKARHWYSGWRCTVISSSSSLAVDNQEDASVSVRASRSAAPRAERLTHRMMAPVRHPLMRAGSTKSEKRLSLMRPRDNERQLRSAARATSRDG